MAIRLSGLSSGLDTEAIVTELVSAYSLKTEKYEKEQTKLEWKQDAWKELNTKVYGLFTKISNMRYSAAYSMKKTSVSDGTKATVTASSDAVTGTQKLKIEHTAESGYLTGAEIKAKNGKDTLMSMLGFSGAATQLKVKGADGSETLIDVTKTTKISDVVDSLKEAGYNASFDETNGRLFVSSRTEGEDGDFTISAITKNGAEDADSLAALNALGLNTNPTDPDKEAAVKIDGQNAEIVLNGVTYYSNTNNFSINGLTIDVLGETADDQEITLVTGTDTQGLYDTVKDFLTEYNTLINEMNKLYNAESAGDYEPLTDEEKDAMSETEIEKWETKIKDSLLRRDNSLGNLLTAMTTAMSSAYEVDGKTYSLSSFGIATLGYFNAAENENYAYHINGDEDDENTANNKDELMAAIRDDADSVVNFMKKLSSNLYNAINEKMTSTELSSAYKVYNDKELDSQYDDYAKLIKKWEEKITEKEDYWYKKFTAMEKALAKLDASTSSITGMLG